MPEINKKRNSLPPRGITYGRTLEPCSYPQGPRPITSVIKEKKSEKKLIALSEENGLLEDHKVLALHNVFSVVNKKLMFLSYKIRNRYLNF
ncbi:hypothetical protein NPIL_186141 [Nephila pilipes]|uniref:Uncharacterized protein n=1 Tax=Nephila pilipes TaxID=299642 RepID=A0A8X6MNH3_NEPPI|nr:hypothetical protein NPIL_186141 [Nephila pilipes]